MPQKTPLAGVVAALLLALAIPAAAQAAKPAKRQFYVSIGDSYAVGWQHPGLNQFGPSKQGFDREIPTLARKKHYKLELANFGCAGATTTSILHVKGCAADRRAIGGRPYESTQAAAAKRFLRH